MCVYIRICAAFCCSEEEGEEAEGGNGNGELYKECILGGWGSNNAGSVTLEWLVHVGDGHVGNGLVKADLGSVSEGCVNDSHEVGAAEHWVGGGADRVVGSAVQAGNVLGRCNSSDDSEGKDEGSGFHIEIFYLLLIKKLYSN